MNSQLVKRMISGFYAGVEQSVGADKGSMTNEQIQKVAIGAAAGLLLIFGTLLVIWRMDVREAKLIQLATFQTCMLSEITHSVRGGGVVNATKYDAMASTCRKTS